MNKKSVITALLALVTMTGQAQAKVHYRLEGFFFMYPIFLGGGTTKIDGRHGRYPRLSGTTLCDDAFNFFRAEEKVMHSWIMDRLRNNPNGGPINIFFFLHFYPRICAFHPSM